MKARTLILTISAAALIAAPAVLIAQHGPGGPAGESFGGPGGHGQHGFLRMLPRLADKLDLSEDQRNRIQTIVETGKPEIEALREQTRTERDAFRDSHEIGDFDETTFRAHFESQAQLHVEMQLAGAEMASQAYAVLTPDQQQELLELMELFRDGHGGKRNGGGKRHGSN